MLYKKLSSLTEISKAQLSKILNSFPGLKDLVLQPAVIKPLERICGVRWLKANNVEKIFKLEETYPNSNNVIFFVIYTNFSVFRQVVDQIRSKVDVENPAKDKYHIIVVPKLLNVFENILEELGLYGTVIKLHSFQWQPIHLDEGIISLEIPDLYKALYIFNDLSLIPIYAKSIWQLAFVTGKFNFCLALGQYSNLILKQAQTLFENFEGVDEVNSDFGALILLDRNVDYASTLLTPTTYTALLNEVYGITCGVCEYKEVESQHYDEKFNLITKKENVHFVLDSSNDSVYKNIKNRCFAEVTETLHNLNKDLRAEGEQSKEMALDEIKKYVSTQLRATASRKKFIVNHMKAAQTIVNVLGHRFANQQHVEQFILQNKAKSKNFAYLEELLVTENNKYISLRLLCLLAITQKLSENETNSFFNKFVQQFGYKYGFVHNNLIKAGFINEEVSSVANISTLPNIVSKLPLQFTSDFYVNASKLKQMPSDPMKINLKTPTCCSYVFRGNYIPLVAQLTSMLLGGTPLNEVKLKLEVLGPLVITNERAYPIKPRILFIYIIGGLTYAEVAACNLLESLTGASIVLCSDKIISGNDIMEANMSLP